MPRLSWRYCLAARKRKRQIALTVVFTNGCFDILHAGHVLYLQTAKTHGDWLIVGLNSDESVRQLKGNSRPINCFEDRKIVLIALEVVDDVIEMHDLTPQKLVEEIIPDVLVKGEDWKEKGAVGAEIVIQNGGKVIYVPFAKQTSTTNILESLTTE